jgi:hypothetical protein
MQMLISTYVAETLKTLCKTSVPLNPVRKKTVRIKWQIEDSAVVFTSVFGHCVNNHRLVIRVDCYK